MTDADQRNGGGVLGAVIGPLMLPARALRDLDAIAEAVRGVPEVTAAVRTLPDFERDLRIRLEALEGLSADVAAIRTELIATRRSVAELRKLVGDAVEHCRATTPTATPEGRSPAPATRLPARETRPGIGA